MSNFALEGSLFTEDPVRLTDNNVTTVFTAQGNTPISSIIVAANSGTPTFTLFKVDASGVSRTLWSGTAPYIFAEYITLPNAYLIKAQSGDVAGKLDIHVTRGAPAAAQGRAG